MAKALPKSVVDRTRGDNDLEKEADVLESRDRLTRTDWMLPCRQ